jgi:hypothetical protein
MVTLVVKGLARRRPKFLVVLLIGGALPVILKCGDDLRLSASGMAIKQQLAVVGFSNGQAWSPVLMGWTFGYPATTDPLVAKGVREFGSAHDKPPSASRRLM